MEAARRVLQPASPPRRRAPAAQAPQDVGRPGPPAPAAQPQGAWATHKSRRALWREAAAPGAPQGTAQARQQQPGPRARGQPAEQAASRRPPTLPPGFDNPGVDFNCFVNSTVQLLAAVPGFGSGLEALRGELQAALQARACAASGLLSPPTGPRGASRECLENIIACEHVPMTLWVTPGCAARYGATAPLHKCAVTARPLTGAAGEQAAVARGAGEEPGMLRAALALADVLTAHRAAAARGARGPLSVRAFRAAVASAGYGKYAIGAPPRAGPHT